MERRERKGGREGEGGRGGRDTLVLCCFIMQVGWKRKMRH